MMLLFGSTATRWGLANVMDMGWAALIVTGVSAVVGTLLFAVGRRMKQVNPKPEVDRRDGQGTAGRAQGSGEELNMTSGVRGPDQIRSNIEQRARPARQYGPISRMIACMSAQWAGSR
jgi:hypothetical protein